MFAYGHLMIEFWSTGAMLSYPTISTLVVDDSDTPFLQIARLGLRILIYIFVGGFLRGEYNEVKEVGCQRY